MAPVLTVIFITLLINVSADSNHTHVVSSLTFVTNQSDSGVYTGSSLVMDLELVFPDLNMSFSVVKVELLTSQEAMLNMLAILDTNVILVGSALNIQTDALEFIRTDKEQREGIVAYYRRSELYLDAIDVNRSPSADERTMVIRFEVMLVPPLGAHLVKRRSYQMICTTYFGMNGINFTVPSNLSYTVRNAIFPTSTNRRKQCRASYARANEGVRFDQGNNTYTLFQGTTYRNIVWDHFSADGLYCTAVKIQAQSPQVTNRLTMTTHNPYEDGCPVATMVNIQVNISLAFPLSRVTLNLSAGGTGLHIVDLRLINAGNNFNKFLEYLPDVPTSVPCTNPRASGREKALNVGMLYNKDASFGHTATESDLLQFVGTVYLNNSVTLGNITAAYISVEINGSESIGEHVRFKAKPSTNPVDVICDGPIELTPKVMKMEDVTEIEIFVTNATLWLNISTNFSYEVVVELDQRPQFGKALEIVNVGKHICSLRDIGTRVTYTCSNIQVEPLRVWASVNPYKTRPGEVDRICFTVTVPGTNYKRRYFVDYKIVDISIVKVPGSNEGVLVDTTTVPGLGATTAVKIRIFPGNNASLNVPTAFGTFFVEFPVPKHNKRPLIDLCPASPNRTSYKLISFDNLPYSTEVHTINGEVYNTVKVVVGRLTYFPKALKTRNHLSIRWIFRYTMDTTTWYTKSINYTVRVTNILNDTLDITSSTNDEVYSSQFTEQGFPRPMVVTSLRLKHVDEWIPLTFHFTTNGIDTDNMTINASKEINIFWPPLIAQHYRFSTKLCKHIASKNARVGTSHVSEYLTVANDNPAGTYLGYLIEVIYHRTCFSLPLLSDKPSFFKVMANISLFSLEPGPFQLNFTGYGLSCNGSDVQMIKVFYSQDNSTTSCAMEVRFCSLCIVADEDNGLRTCSYNCLCPAVSSCAFVHFLLVNYGTEPWGLCAINAINI